MKKWLLICGLLVIDPIYPPSQNPNAPNTTMPWGYNYIPPANRPWERGEYNSNETIIIDRRTIIISPRLPFPFSPPEIDE